MRITGATPNLFTSNYKPVAKTENEKNFFNALEEKLTSKTAEAQKADDMTTAIKDLDKSLEKAENDKFVELSKAQADWLKNRYDINNIQVVQYEVELDSQGNRIESVLGGPNEEYHNLINTLHELGILSDHDMGILNTDYKLVMLRPPATNGDGQIGQITKIDDSNIPFWRRFYSAPIEIWSRDISNSQRAIADQHLEIFKYLKKPGNTQTIAPEYAHLVPPDEWYEESAEVRNRLADIFDQIFGN